MTRKSWIAWISCIICFCYVCFAITAQAQSTFSTLIGTVSDQNQAVVTGATVTITNKGTTAVRKVSTNSYGNYEVRNLEPGIYQVTIEASGFRRTLFEMVTLLARETIRLDAQLSVAGANAETVTITAGSGITSEVPTIAVTKTNRELQELPVPFRASGTTSPISTLTTQTGVQIDNSGSLSLAGSQRYSTSVTIDGISTVSVRSNGPINELFPSVESISEIRVSQINNNAEFAQSGDITTISKSGTNTYHGSAFWYHQNSALDARNPFSSTKPFKVSNDYGFTAGGPVRLPRFGLGGKPLYDGRDKTFFFATYEAGRLRQETLRIYSVPPTAWRTGDLSSITTPIRDPIKAGNCTATDQTACFPGNKIPANRISSVSAKTLDLFYPQPNFGGASATSNNLRQLFPAPTDSDQFDVRIDQNLSQIQSVFGRFTWKKRKVESYESGILPPIGSVRRPEKDWAFTGAYNFVIRPNLLNEFRGGFSGRNISKDFGSNGAQLVSQLGIQGLSSNLPSSPGVPNIGFTGFTTTGISRGFTTTDRTYQFLDNLTWTKGRHTLKFGVDIRRLSTTDLLSFTTGDDFGDYTFDGSVTRTNPFAGFLLGIPDRTQYAVTGPDIDGSVWHDGFFMQDDWKATSKLTLNFGVRYELHPPFTEKNFNITNFDRKTGNAIVANEEARRAAAPGFVASIGTNKVVTAKEAGYAEVLRSTDYNNFAPRFGFAYRPLNNAKTVIRGGYGIYTISILGSVFYSLTGVHTSDVRAFENSFTNNQPAFQFPLPFLGGTGRVAAVGTQDFRTANQLDYRDPYNQQWSLTFEQELGWDTAARVTYNGQHAIKLTVGPDLNQIPTNTVGFATANAARPYPNWNIIFTRDNGGTANFHGLTAELNKRLSKGVLLTSSYAWSKNLSNAEGSAPSSFSAENGPRLLDRFNLRGDYGNVSFTRRHRFLTTYIWELPIGRKHAFLNNVPGVVDQVLGGWQMSGILLFQTGPFLTPTFTGTDPSGTGASRRASQRPDLTGNPIPSTQDATKWFERAAYTTPANNIGRYGTSSVGSLVGPGTKNFSMALAKKFYFTERTGLHFEAQFSNILNHLNLGVPSTNTSTSAFGSITTTQTAEGTGPRVIQMGLRLFF